MIDREPELPTIEHIQARNAQARCGDAKDREGAEAELSYIAGTVH